MDFIFLLVIQILCLLLWLGIKENMIYHDLQNNSYYVNLMRTEDK